MTTGSQWQHSRLSVTAYCEQDTDDDEDNGQRNDEDDEDNPVTLCSIRNKRRCQRAQREDEEEIQRKKNMNKLSLPLLLLPLCLLLMTILMSITAISGTLTFLTVASCISRRTSAVEPCYFVLRALFHHLHTRATVLTLLHFFTGGNAWSLRNSVK